MPYVNLTTVKASARINGRNYPMYSGFLSAEQLKRIAEVPSFSKTKAHHQIASDIFTPPVDQWQRPLDTEKTDKIRKIYSDTTKDNLMANPVLIGVAIPNIDTSVNISVRQESLQAQDGSVLPVQDFYRVTVNFLDDKKPLWILDGQHRIEGMLLSAQKDEPIPFVLLYHDSHYTPPFLAEIFTQVTTGATPMQSLHAEWMKYAFRLDQFGEPAHQKSMETVIHLCKESAFGTVTNPLQNKIQFNPYLPLNGYYAFAFNMEEWEKIIAENYFSGGRGTLNPQDLAAEIAKLIRALESTDQYRNNGSKVFSNDTHRILAEGFLCGALSYLANHNCQKSVQQWIDFFNEPDRQLNRCDWRLLFVSTVGSLSSSYTSPSKVIAKECFDLWFSSPSELGGNLLTDYLQGVSAKIRITANPKTSAGRISNRDRHEKTFSPSVGLIPFNTSEGGIPRDFIRIESDSPNCHVIRVADPNYNPPRPLDDATKRGGLDISSFIAGAKIQVTTMSYSSDTVISTIIRLDK